jgi:diguanylate cyclase (GGDEF)-like protein
MQANKLIVYADLNCPFCYALHERLMDAGSLSQVEWRLIEHVPQSNFSTQDVQVQSELSTEIKRLKLLAPEISIKMPPGRPKTLAANELLTELQHQAAQNTGLLRGLLYRALWVEGRDISDPRILDELLTIAGLERPSISQASHDTLKTWQEEWELGDFSRNIPAMVTSDGNKLLGLPTSSFLAFFLQGREVDNGAQSEAICKLTPRERLLIASNDSELSTAIAVAFEDYDTLICQDDEQTLQAVLADDPPALILIDTDLPAQDSGQNGYDTCWRISEHTEGQITPIILLSAATDDAAEIRAFEMGATDFVHKDFSPKVLRARVRTLLRLKRASDLLDEVAHVDPLTEIPNRREYDRAIEVEWRQAMRNQSPLSVILVDIDHFKQYNDNYGHQEGDKCLRKVARFLRCNINRPSDVVARYGGEEFIVVLPDTGAMGAMNIAQVMRDQLEQLDIPFEHSPTAAHITVSQGVATINPGPNNTLSDLIAAADRALYQAKDAGRNRIVAETLSPTD